MRHPDPYLRELAVRGFRPGDTARFLAAWERLESAYFARIAAVVASGSTWRERFRLAATETARLAEAHPDETRFLAVDALAAGALGAERQRAFGDRAAILVDSVRDELQDAPAIPVLTSSWIVAIFFDRVYRRCMDPGGRDLPSQLPELLFLGISAYFGTTEGLEELIPPP